MTSELAFGIGALGRVQGLLFRLKQDDRVTFDELIETELSAQCICKGEDGPVTLVGPRGIRLRSSTVQTHDAWPSALCPTSPWKFTVHRPEGNGAAWAMHRGR